MKIFIDTANVDEIRAAWSMGIISGVTTNPSLVAREGRNFRQVLEEIVAVVDGPISAEVLSLETAEMVAEARQLAAIHPNIVIKIPMTAEGLRAVATLTKEGIQRNAITKKLPAISLNDAQDILRHASANYHAVTVQQNIKDNEGNLIPNVTGLINGFSELGVYIDHQFIAFEDIRTVVRKNESN